MTSSSQAIACRAASCAWNIAPDGLFLVDLESTNGTFINDESRARGEHRLNRGDQLKVGDTIFKFLSGSDVESQYHEIIFQMTVTDGLTNLTNRKQLDTLLAEEFLRARRHARDLSVLMLDIDHFKEINDTYGHLTGDSVLRGLASILQKRCAPTTSSDATAARSSARSCRRRIWQVPCRIAEELRGLVAAHSFTAEGREIRVTVSIGAAALAEATQPEQLYKTADEMLYQAKRTGRNKVCY